MYDEIKIEDVANQITKAIVILLKWQEQRIRNLTFQSNNRDDVYIPQEKHLLRAAEAANLLNVSKSKVYQMIKNGIIPCVKFGRSVRIRKQDLKEFIEKQIE